MALLLVVTGELCSNTDCCSLVRKPDTSDLKAMYPEKLWINLDK